MKGAVAILILWTFSAMAFPTSARVLSKRAAFYIANNTMCIVDGVVFLNGDPVPTDDYCEKCTCRPPGFSCVLRDCEVKPGCKAVRKDGECCPDYICGCTHSGRVYRDGEMIRDLQNPCYTCRCHGSTISCTFADCFFRSDCAPEYIQGECCPRYDHCPPLSTTTKTTTVRSTDPIIYDPTTMDLFNLTTRPYETYVHLTTAQEEEGTTGGMIPGGRTTASPEITEAFGHSSDTGTVFSAELSSFTTSGEVYVGNETEGDNTEESSMHDQFTTTVASMESNEETTDSKDRTTGTFFGHDDHPGTTSGSQTDTHSETNEIDASTAVEDHASSQATLAIKLDDEFHSEENKFSSSSSTLHTEMATDDPVTFTAEAVSQAVEAIPTNNDLKGLAISAQEASTTTGENNEAGSTTDSDEGQSSGAIGLFTASVPDQSSTRIDDDATYATTHEQSVDTEDLISSTLVTQQQPSEGTEPHTESTALTVTVQLPHTENIVPATATVDNSPGDIECDFASTTEEKQTSNVFNYVTSTVVSKEKPSDIIDNLVSSNPVTTETQSADMDDHTMSTIVITEEQLTTEVDCHAASTVVSEDEGEHVGDIRDHVTSVTSITEKNFADSHTTPIVDITEEQSGDIGDYTASATVTKDAAPMATEDQLADTKDEVTSTTVMEEEQSEEIGNQVTSTETENQSEEIGGHITPTQDIQPEDSAIKRKETTEIVDLTTSTAVMMEEKSPGAVGPGPFSTTTEERESTEATVAVDKRTVGTDDHDALTTTIKIENQSSNTDDPTSTTTTIKIEKQSSNTDDSTTTITTAERQPEEEIRVESFVTTTEHHSNNIGDNATATIAGAEEQSTEIDGNTLPATATTEERSEDTNDKVTSAVVTVEEQSGEISTFATSIVEIEPAEGHEHKTFTNAQTNTHSSWVNGHQTTIPVNVKQQSENVDDTPISITEMTEKLVEIERHTSFTTAVTEEQSSDLGGVVDEKTEIDGQVISNTTMMVEKSTDSHYHDSSTTDTLQNLLEDITTSSTVSPEEQEELTGEGVEENNDLIVFNTDKEDDFYQNTSTTSVMEEQSTDIEEHSVPTTVEEVLLTTEQIPPAAATTDQESVQVKVNSASASFTTEEQSKDFDEGILSTTGVVEEHFTSDGDHDTSVGGDIKQRSTNVYLYVTTDTAIVRKPSFENEHSGTSGSAIVTHHPFLGEAQGETQKTLEERSTSISPPSSTTPGFGTEDGFAETTDSTHEEENDDSLSTDGSEERGNKTSTNRIGSETIMAVTLTEGNAPTDDERISDMTTASEEQDSDTSPSDTDIKANPPAFESAVDGNLHPLTSNAEIDEIEEFQAATTNASPDLFSRFEELSSEESFVDSYTTKLPSLGYLDPRSQVRVTTDVDTVPKAERSSTYEIDISSAPTTITSGKYSNTNLDTTDSTAPSTDATSIDPTSHAVEIGTETLKPRISTQLIMESEEASTEYPKLQTHSKLQEELSSMMDDDYEEQANDLRDNLTPQSEDTLSPEIAWPTTAAEFQKGHEEPDGTTHDVSPAASGTEEQPQDETTIDDTPQVEEETVRPRDDQNESHTIPSNDFQSNISTSDVVGLIEGEVSSDTSIELSTDDRSTSATDEDKSNFATGLLLSETDKVIEEDSVPPVVSENLTSSKSESVDNNATGFSKAGINGGHVLQDDLATIEEDAYTTPQDYSTIPELSDPENLSMGSTKVGNSHVTENYRSTVATSVTSTADSGEIIAEGEEIFENGTAISFSTNRNSPLPSEGHDETASVTTKNEEIEEDGNEELSTKIGEYDSSVGSSENNEQNEGSTESAFTNDEIAEKHTLFTTESEILPRTVTASGEIETTSAGNENLTEEDLVGKEFGGGPEKGGEWFEPTFPPDSKSLIDENLLGKHDASGSEEFNKTETGESAKFEHGTLAVPTPSERETTNEGLLTTPSSGLLSSFTSSRNSEETQHAITSHENTAAITQDSLSTFVKLTTDIEEVTHSGSDTSTFDEIITDELPLEISEAASKESEIAQESSYQETHGVTSEYITSGHDEDSVLRTTESDVKVIFANENDAKPKDFHLYDNNELVSDISQVTGATGEEDDDVQRTSITALTESGEEQHFQTTEVPQVTSSTVNVHSVDVSAHPTLRLSSTDYKDLLITREDIDGLESKKTSKDSLQYSTDEREITTGENSYSTENASPQYVHSQILSTTPPIPILIQKLGSQYKEYSNSAGTAEIGENFGKTGDQNGKTAPGAYDEAVPIPSVHDKNKTETIEVTSLPVSEELSAISSSPDEEGTFDNSTKTTESATHADGNAESKHKIHTSRSSSGRQLNRRPAVKVKCIHERHSRISSSPSSPSENVSSQDAKILAKFPVKEESRPSETNLPSSSEKPGGSSVHLSSGGQSPLEKDFRDSPGFEQGIQQETSEDRTSRTSMKLEHGNQRIKTTNSAVNLNMKNSDGGEIA